MKIPEISIRGTSGKRKKYSQKVKVAACEYLAAKGLTIEGLTDSQQDIVFGYIKSKRCVKWTIFFSLIMSCFLGLVCLYGYINVMKPIFEELAPVVVEDGQSPTSESLSDDQLNSNYGFACFLLGAFFGALFYQCFSTLGWAIVSLLELREKGRILGAFLPACSSG